MNLLQQPSDLSPAQIDTSPSTSALARPTLLCLSHLRWGFVYQRPQHVMSRLAKDYDVLFFEEPIFGEKHGAEPHLDVSQPAVGVTVVVPHLPHGATTQQVDTWQRELLDGTSRR
jgi:hypothetical protein